MKYKSIINAAHYENLPIMECKGPFYEADLEKIHTVTFNALAEHPRTAAFRFDLHLPGPYHFVERSRLMERFCASLCGQIENSRQNAKLKNVAAHMTGSRFIWSRECAPDGREHYHLVLFLNYNAIKVFGNFKAGLNNLYNRIVKAWCSALAINSFEEVCGLVHIPANAVYEVRRDNQQSIDKFFYRASYLAKTATKIQDGRHRVGGSRR